MKYDAVHPKSSCSFHILRAVVIEYGIFRTDLIPVKKQTVDLFLRLDAFHLEGEDSAVEIFKEPKLVPGSMIQFTGIVRQIIELIVLPAEICKPICCVIKRNDRTFKAREHFPDLCL